MMNCILKAMEFELSKYSESIREVQKELPGMDLRVNHILVYFNCNGVSRELKQLALYDLFRTQIYADVNIRMKILQTLANVKYNEYLLASLAGAASNSSSISSASITSQSSGSTSISPNVFKTYEKWLLDYRDYR